MVANQKSALKAESKISEEARAKMAYYFDEQATGSLPANLYSFTNGQGRTKVLGEQEIRAEFTSKMNLQGIPTTECMRALNYEHDGSKFFYPGHAAA